MDRTAWLALKRAAEGACAWANDADGKGTLLGCWRTEIGTLGRVLIPRGFHTQEDMSSERHRALLSANPFNGGGIVIGLEMDSYAPFPFLPPIQTGARGGVYEVRTYRLRPGGLPTTLAGWEAAINPAWEYTAHPVINMHALDGPPHITHIWAFDSLEERAMLRANAYGAESGHRRAVQSR